MNVGIVTFHCSYNFGSALQTYALKRLIEKMGHVARVVDYRGRDFDAYRVMRLNSFPLVASSLLAYRRNCARRDSFEAFQRRWFDLTDRYTYEDERRMVELQDKFDCFVCGSDQIWNLDCTCGPVSPYFLEFAGEVRRVAYAPSLAHTSFQPEHFTEDDRQFIAAQLDRFSAISVREAVTVPLFQPLTNRTIETCLDPTLLLDREDYAPITNDEAISKGRYVFVYMLERNDAVNRQAERVARSLGARIEYVSKWPQRFGVASKNRYGIGPSEFLGLLAHAEAVVTNSFHATVFSLLFGVPFQTLATKNSGSRMHELLSEVGECSHLIEAETDGLPTAVNVGDMQMRLERLRDSSQLFLHQALME